ncbi:MAG TPA: ATP-binding protein [Gemmatimonadaceae bacterium]|nr:ATP-binding protein [Gemmatimonadaceae bacterium]
MVAGVTVLSAVGVHAVALYLQARQTALDVGRERVLSLDSQLASLFAAAARQQATLLQEFARSPALAIGPPAADSLALATVLDSLLRRASQPIAATLLDPAGSVLLARPTPRLVPDSLHTQLLALANPGGAPVVGPVALVNDLVVHSVAVRLERSRRVLVLWRRIGAANVQALEQLRQLIGSSTILYLGNRDTGLWTNLVEPVSVPPRLGADGEVVEYERGPSGRRLAAFQRVPGTPWTIGVEMPYSAVLAAPRRMLARLVLFSTILGAAGVSAAWWLGRRLTRPLRELADNARLVSTGDYSRRLVASSNDEVGDLATALNSMLDSVREMKARLEANVQQLSQSEARYRLLFEATPQPMWVYDLETLRFMAVNEAAVAHYGYSREEFLAMTIKDIRPEEEVPRLLEFLEDGLGDASRSGPWRHRKKDGTPIQVEISSHDVVFEGRPARLVVVQDVTERLALEERLRQSQKLEAVGQLAAGLAHDFNNMLSVIYAECDLARDHPALSSVARQAFEEISRAAERAGILTRQLLAFSRKQVVEPVLLDVNEVIQGLESMLPRLIGEHITYRTHLDPAARKVSMDRALLEQVLINLAVNARDAMPDGGSLVVSTSSVTLDEEYVRSHPDARAGDYMLITVSDTGTGMTDYVKAHLFEPFFTTKPPGKGTGLGLATSYGIVRQFGGHIGVYSEPGVGTTMKVYLPVDESHESETTHPAVEPQRGGTETILLVEDEEQLRNVLARVLRGRGYTVLEADNGRSALELLSSTKVDLLLTDVVLPQVSGRSLAEEAQRRHPDLRVLFMSGYTDDTILRAELLHHGVALLQKPFTTVALTRKVREILDQTGSAN